MSEESLEREAVSGFGILRACKTGPLRPRWKLRALKPRLTIAFGVGQAYAHGRPRIEKENSGLAVCLQRLMAPAGCPRPRRRRHRMEHGRW